MRTGAELVRASNPYAREDRGLTWRLLVVTYGLYAAAVALTLVDAVPLPVRLASSVLVGLTLVRMFIFYHDYLHGAILQKSPLGTAVMHLTGYLMLSAPSVWKETHDYHHKHTAKMVGAAIGSYPVVTVGMWKGMTPAQRTAYRLVRHPVNMLLGYFTVFLAGMCLSAFRRNPKTHADAAFAVVFHFGLAALIGFTAGWTAALLAVVLPGMMSTAAGSYLFYAQHNFPNMHIANRRDWEYSAAATRSSSFFDMNPVMHWFTGNIGYHHVHHLNHRIPFYRLPEAMREMPELQSPGRTSWSPQDVLACLRLAIWDPGQGRMLNWDEVESAARSDADLMSAK